MSKNPKRPTAATNTSPGKRARMDPSTQTDTSTSCLQEVVMTTEGLLNVLEDLGDEEFKTFKWHLQQGRTAIPKARLERAERRDTVTLMVQTYTLTKAVGVTKKHLKKMNRNDLVQDLSESSSKPVVDDSDAGSSSQTVAPHPPSSSPTDEPNLNDNQPTNSGTKLVADEAEDPQSAVTVGGSPSRTALGLDDTPLLPGLDGQLGPNPLRLDQGLGRSLAAGLSNQAQLRMNTSSHQALSQSSKMSFNNKTSMSQSQSHSTALSFGSRLWRKLW